ncbi:hypothetical protein V5O48_009990 [Marasmius crinis-equi]|uniref:Carboxylic ester hydrolase n=1 Tax=Marasmius crinis-equi TaxID=585013 RepID=A0ABR3F9L3_9AGAR
MTMQTKTLNKAVSLLSCLAWSLVGLTSAASLDALASCGTFAQDPSHNESDYQIQRSKYYGRGSLNINNITNNVAFCRVYGQVPYGDNNTVNFELWLPEADSYRGSYLAVGNGGMAGTIDTSALLRGLSEGFAVAGGDSGHLASENNDGNGAPGIYLPYLHDQDQVLAWIRNSVALFTAPAKELVQKYYSRAAEKSYYVGCSTGGAQGFALAQYHPEVFDGIIAGSPGNWYSHLALSFLWNAQATPYQEHLTQETLDTITSAVLETCDKLDGVQDNLIEDPLACNFDLSTLACSSSESSPTNCLNDTQLAAAHAVYSGPHSSEYPSIYPGFSLSSEAEWALQLGSLADAFSIPILQNLVYDNLTYDPSQFDWDVSVGDVDERAGKFIDAIGSDLTAFRDRGGKLIVYQGWTDPFNAATWPIEHLQQIEDTMGGNVGEWMRLFMIPGEFIDKRKRLADCSPAMTGGGHCGAATSTFYKDVPGDYRTTKAIVDWAEDDIAPEEIKSESLPTQQGNWTRKLCAWPNTARFEGGDSRDWMSYTCA